VPSQNISKRLGRCSGRSQCPRAALLLDMRASLGFRHGKADPRYAVDFGKLSPQEIFTERTRQFGFELQNYLKLLRKGNPEHVKPAVRYLLIAEMHNSATTSDEMRGRPHFHILLHEQQGRSALVNGNPVRLFLMAGTVSTKCDE